VLGVNAWGDRANDATPAEFAAGQADVVAAETNLLDLTVPDTCGRLVTQSALLSEYVPTSAELQDRATDCGGELPADDSYKTALKTVSTERGELREIQGRLHYTPGERVAYTAFAAAVYIIAATGGLLLSFENGGPVLDKISGPVWSWIGSFRHLRGVER
jgi:hypothetical protein